MAAASILTEAAAAPEPGRFRSIYVLPCAHHWLLKAILMIVML